VPTITPPPTTLTIEEPVDGTVVRFTPVTLRGTAPAGSIVTRDISFGFDEHTTTGRTGRWSLTVDLFEGENVIVLRLGDDRTTEQRIRVILTR
jgi:hypothetical protein